MIRLLRFTVVAQLTIFRTTKSPNCGSLNCTGCERVGLGVLFSFLCVSTRNRPLLVNFVFCARQNTPHKGSAQTTFTLEREPGNARFLGADYSKLNGLGSMLIRCKISSDPHTTRSSSLADCSAWLLWQVWAELV